jgi:hypothetical protein
VENNLPSWNNTPTKQAILDFVTRVTDPGSPEFVPAQERVAAFDNDGTLWCEKPMYIQLDFILRKLAARAETDPSLRSREARKAAWEKDFDWFEKAMRSWM